MDAGKNFGPLIDKDLMSLCGAVPNDSLRNRRVIAPPHSIALGFGRLNSETKT